jgi:protoporphyrinogen oxidase
LVSKHAEDDRCVIIGAGPAGLTAAYELSKLGIPAIVLEQDDVVGGLSRTASYKGYCFDIGGHRFFTKVDFVQSLWEEVLGEDFLVRPRLSRIYYNGKFYDYPLKPLNALLGLGALESFRIGLSYLVAQLFPHREERNFEQWVTNRFGRRLYEIFFKSYTEKVWGIPCREIGADWAAQRIKNLDLVAAVRNALLGSGARRGRVVSTLIDQFHYPRLGPGMMWERFRDTLRANGYRTVTGTEVIRIRHTDGKVVGLTVRDRSGKERDEPGTHFLSSMPIRNLVGALDPPAPPEVLEAAERLRYRDFLTVVLIVDRAEVFPDNWIYIHSPDVRLGRIQNFKNWSPEMVPDPSTTSLGLEIFVQQGDELWNASDEELIQLGQRECALLGLIDEAEVIDGTVVRMPKAYPVYDDGYKNALGTVRDYLDKLSNLQLIGRNGQHRYNNQDHSMVTATYAAQNLAGAKHDVWTVNVEEEYHEEVREPEPEVEDRLVPGRPSRDVGEELIRSVFARYDPVALGGSIGVILGLGVFLATVVLLLRGGEPVGPTLSLLGNYLLGYYVSWGGAFLGLLEAGFAGFGFGFLLAKTINAVVGWHETAFRRRAEMARTLDMLEEPP